VTILAVEGKDWVPSIYRDYLKDRDAGFEAPVAQVCEEWEKLVQTFRTHSAATLLVHSLAPPTWHQLGLLDGQDGSGQAQWIHRLNESLASICHKASGCWLVDYAGLVSRHGALCWYDERMNFYARAPIATEMFPHLAGEYMKFLRSLTGQTKKCLVLDLDNTLWGGVLGEEGVHGIQLGSEYPGSAYVAFQETILNLHKRGVILAVATKNNPADVDEVFAHHPYMLLKKENFASLQIHWKPKSESVAEISKRLNIGLEHMVLVDDNPVECEEVAQALPMVVAICLPKQPEHFVQALLQEGLFDSLSFSAEDRRRGELYRQHEQVETLRQRSGTLEDFYRSLKMEVSFSAVGKTSLGRSVQLTQKTNQFNLTTLRYGESDFVARMKDPDWLLVTVGVRDHFGDNGIVGLIMARSNGDALDVDTFLLSCRVIGRTIETAMLAYLCDQASRRGLQWVRGRVIPTAKNGPARDLYERHGFQKLAEDQSGETSWALDLSGGRITWPDWMRVTVDAPVAAKS
jgi:FkbH-like protein